MDAKELFNQVKEHVTNGDMDKAKAFIEEQKENLGEYYEKAKGLVEGSDIVGNAMDKVKGLFGK